MEKIPLSNELRQALDQQPEGIEVEDTETQKVYFISDPEFHQRAVDALRQQEDWESIQESIAQADRGETIPLAEADKQIREEFGFPSQQ